MGALEKEGKHPISSGIVLSEPEGGWFWVSGETKCWIGSRGCIEIRFDLLGKVALRLFQQWQPVNPDPVERLRDWLDW
jgi:hypothetical protein